MYELTRISLMNWNLIDIQDIDLRGTTALIGAVGVGKSTLLDAIQTILNGNQKSKLQLNRAAGIIKSKRTVLDYCLGVTEDTERLGLVRKSCYSMIVLSFRDNHLNHDCSIGLVLHANGEDTKEKTQVRFVAPGVPFSFEEYADRDEDGNIFVESPEIILERVRKASGNGYKTHNQSAGAFVDSYLRIMRPKGGTPNAGKFLNRFRNAIAFEEIADPTEFVRNFILDEDPIDTVSLRTNLETWDEIAQTVEGIENKISSAKTVRQRYIRHFENVMDSNEAKYQIAWAQEGKLSLEIKGKESEVQEIDESIGEVSLEIAAGRVQIQREEAERDRKKDQERASGYSESQALTKKEIELHKAHLKTSAEKLAQIISTAAKLKHTDSLAQFLPDYVKSARAKAADLEQTIKTMTSKGEVFENTRDLAETLAEIRSAGRAAEALRANLETEQKEKIRLEESFQDTKRSLQATRKGGAVLGHHTQRFIDLLREEGIAGEALPTLVSIQAGMEGWARAAEATLGANREAVFVSPDQFTEAANILRNARKGGEQDLWNVRLANTARIDQGRGVRSARANAVVSILETKNDNVRKFLDSQFGHVEMVETIEELREHSSGIMRDCTQSQALTVRVHRNLDPILGQVAQDSLRNSFKFKLEDLEQQMRRQDIVIRNLQHGIPVFEALSEIRIEDVGEHLAAMTSHKEEISDLESSLNAEVEPEVRSLREGIQAHEKRIRALRESVDNDLSAKRTNLEKKKARLETEVAVLLSRKEDLSGELQQLIQQDQGDFYNTFRKALSEMDHPAQNRKISLLAQDLEDTGERDHNWQDNFLKEAKARQAEARRVEDHATRRLRQISPFLEEYSEDRSVAELSAEKIMSWLSALISNLENNELLKHAARIQEFRDNTRREVKEDFLLKLHDSLQRAQTELKKLNRRLKSHRFEGMTYYFDWKIDPTMRPLYEMARRVADEPKRADALISTGGDEALDSAINTIREIFANEGDACRFEDYRQYFQYEIRMTHDEVTDADIDTQGAEGMHSQIASSGSLSDRVAKGSGGQKQTPYYVAIAASMAAAYYPKSRAGESMGMGLVCFDEAFSKLDVKNTQELIRFFKQLNLQIVVAAPEEKRASFMELMDTIVNISKIPGEPELFIETQYIGARARNELKGLNPDRIGLEGYREILKNNSEQRVLEASH